MCSGTRQTTIVATQLLLIPRLTCTMVPLVVVALLDWIARSRDLASNSWPAISEREITLSSWPITPMDLHRQVCRSSVRIKHFLLNFPKTSCVFFIIIDFDSIVVTVPSIYGPRELSNATDPFISALNSTTINNGTTGSTNVSNSTSSASPNALPMTPNSLLLLVLTFVLLLRPFSGRRTTDFY